MKKKVFHINIPKPCKEGWQNMTPTEKGAFCASCQKEVIDFTQKTPTEIARYFVNKKGESCGRLYASQLNKTYTHYEPQKQNNLKYAAGLALGLLVAENSFAQDDIKPKTEIIGRDNNSKGYTTQYNNLIQDSLIIRGIILDDKTNEALVGVFIFEKNTKNESVTNIDGTFEIKVSKLPTELLFSYITYDTDSIIIDRNYIENKIIKLKQTDNLIGEVVIIQKPRDDAYSGQYSPIIHKKKKKK